MVVSVNLENNCTVDNNSNLIEFNINVLNLEKYFEVGCFNEILNYTNISFPVLDKLPRIQEVLKNEKLMMHVLENCNNFSCIYFHSNSNSNKFSYYSLNIIKKIFELSPPKSITSFDNTSVFCKLYYDSTNECYDKIIYVLSYCLENNINLVNDYCWLIYLRACMIKSSRNGNVKYNDYDKTLVLKLQKLFKELNKEDEIFKNRKIDLNCEHLTFENLYVCNNLYCPKYFIEALQYSTHVKIIQIKKYSFCSIS